MKAKKVLFITQEIVPYLPASQKATVGRTLPQIVQESGREIRTFMPKWGDVNERRNQLHEVIRLSGMNLIIDDTDHPLIIKVASIQAARMQVYFIDNDDYFLNVNSTSSNESPVQEENDSRAIFYARGVLETVKKLRWSPEIIHCQGWMSALAPLYIKCGYKDEPSFAESKVVFSLFDDELMQPFPVDFPTKIAHRGVTKECFDVLGEAPYSYNSLIKLALEYSDGLLLHTDNVSQEILDFATEKGIPIHRLVDGEEKAQSCVDFFDVVWSAGKNEE